MDDSKLLELAGLAAGETYSQERNPLERDDLALRLAVKLGIAPIQDQKEKVCAAYWTDVHCAHSAYKDDPYAATRRAIVRAAAEIGRNMK